MRFLFGALLLVHGLIHIAWFAPKPADPRYPFTWRSPWFPKASEATLKAVAIPVIVVVIVGFAVSALGVWGVGELAEVWGLTALVSASASVFVTLLLWHPWFVAAPPIDAAIIATVLMGWVR